MRHVWLRSARETAVTAGRAVNGAMVVAAVALVVSLIAVALMLAGRR